MKIYFFIFWFVFCFDDGFDDIIYTRRQAEFFRSIGLRISEKNIFEQDKSEERGALNIDKYGIWNKDPFVTENGELRYKIKYGFFDDTLEDEAHRQKIRKNLELFSSEICIDFEEIFDESEPAKINIKAAG